MPPLDPELALDVWFIAVLSSGLVWWSSAGYGVVVGIVWKLGRGCDDAVYCLPRTLDCLYGWAASVYRCWSSGNCGVVCQANSLPFFVTRSSSSGLCVSTFCSLTRLDVILPLVSSRSRLPSRILSSVPQASRSFHPYPNPNPVHLSYSIHVLPPDPERAPTKGYHNPTPHNPLPLPLPLPLHTHPPPNYHLSATNNSFPTTWRYAIRIASLICSSFKFSSADSSDWSPWCRMCSWIRSMAVGVTGERVVLGMRRRKRRKGGKRGERGETYSCQVYLSRMVSELYKQRERMESHLRSLHQLLLRLPCCSTIAQNPHRMRAFHAREKD